MRKALPFADAPPEPARLRAAPLRRLLYDTDQAGRALNLSPRMVWALADAGDLPAIRIGAKLLRFDPVQLAEWVKAGCPCSNWLAKKPAKRAADTEGDGTET